LVFLMTSPELSIISLAIKDTFITLSIPKVLVMTCQEPRQRHMHTHTDTCRKEVYIFPTASHCDRYFL
jgi:hypothetical protein